MSNIKKFILTYDAEYDADIGRLLEEIPAGRRSERVRQLIRQGVAAERQSTNPAAPVQTQQVPQVDVQKPRKTLGSPIRPPE